MSAVEAQALWLSLQVAFVGTLVGLPLALGLGVLMARVEFYGKFIVNVLIHLPMVMPPVAMGYILLLSLGQGGWLHQAFGIQLAFTWTAAAIAASLMGFPFLVRAVRLSVEAIDQNQQASAQILGASPHKRFFYITLPLALPGIIAGFVMAFGRALGEFGATIVVAGSIPGQTRTLPLALYDALQYPGGEAPALRFALLALGLAALALALSEVALRSLHRGAVRRT